MRKIYFDRFEKIDKIFTILLSAVWYKVVIHDKYLCKDDINNRCPDQDDVIGT